MCVPLIWCLIRGFGFTNQSSREGEQEAVSKTEAPKHVLCEIAEADGR